MDLLRTVALSCPHCGEDLDIAVDCSVGEQRYVEDCGVCCSPILLDVRVDDTGEPDVTARREND